MRGFLWDPPRVPTYYNFAWVPHTFFGGLTPPDPPPYFAHWIEPGKITSQNIGNASSRIMSVRVISLCLKPRLHCPTRLNSTRLDLNMFRTPRLAKNWRFSVELSWVGSGSGDGALILVHYPTLMLMCCQHIRIRTMVQWRHSALSCTLSPSPSLYRVCAPVVSFDRRNISFRLYQTSFKT